MSKRKLSDAQIAEIKRRLLARSVFWQSQRSLARRERLPHEGLGICLHRHCGSLLRVVSGSAELKIGPNRPV